jgi:hypothetical protein
VIGLRKCSPHVYLHFRLGGQVKVNQNTQGPQLSSIPYHLPSIT